METAKNVMSDNQTVAVVVTYNRLEMLKDCLSALERQTAPCDVLVIDNASTDGTKAFLDAAEKVSHIRMKENTGGAGGFNAGLKEAVKRGYKYAWIMDDDTIPFPDTLEKLLEADRVLQGNYGWLCSVPLWKDGKECRMNRPKLLKAFYLDIHLMRYGLVRGEQATFVSLFLKTGTVRECGLPIKEFFIWGDDIEYTRRMSVRKKLPCYVAGQSRITHAMKENVGSSIALDSQQRLERYNYAFRNENYLYRQEGIRGVIYYIGKCGLNILRILFQAKDSRLKRCGIILKQMVLGVFFNPKVEYVGRTGYE